jgi:hypothetical protein
MTTAMANSTPMGSIGICPVYAGVPDGGLNT